MFDIFIVEPYFYSLGFFTYDFIGYKNNVNIKYKPIPASLSGVKNIDGTAIIRSGTRLVIAYIKKNLLPINTFKTSDDVMPIMYSDKSPIMHLYAKERTRLPANGVILVKTGVKVDIPEGYILEIGCDRNICMYGIMIPDAPEYITNIDKDKEIKIALYWDGNESAYRQIGSWFEGYIDIDAGTCIAKAILKKVERPYIKICDEKEYGS